MKETKNDAPATQPAAANKPLRRFFFPDGGVTIEAESYEAACEILKNRDR